MNMLQQIIRHKKLETEARKRARPVAQLIDADGYHRPVNSFSRGIKDCNKSGIIAEFKRRSPSKGMINADADVQTVTGGYTEYGASALSILTDEDFFGGGSRDLRLARNNNDIPILRKDFIVDPYQVTEARAMGADAILLIAAALAPAEVQQLAHYAHSLQLEVLLEVHNYDELDRVCPDIDVIGVNNRNLHTFTTDLQHSIDLLPYLPEGPVKISESGIRTADEVHRLRAAGFDGCLIGSLFMRHPSPQQAFAAFIKELA